MKNISKRIVALVLAVAIMVTSLPTMASAVAENANISGKSTLKFEDAYYDIDNLEFEDYEDLVGLFHKVGNEKVEITNENWSSSNTAVATVNNDGYVQSVMEGTTTLSCEVTYVHSTYSVVGGHWFIVWIDEYGWVDDAPQKITLTKDIEVVPDYKIELEVGVTKEVKSFGSEWLYDWEFVNNGVFSTNVNTRGIDKRTVTGLKPGVGYFYKDGVNKYLYKVVVTGEEPQPENETVTYLVPVKDAQGNDITDAVVTMNVTANAPQTLTYDATKHAYVLANQDVNGNWNNLKVIELTIAKEGYTSQTFRQEKVTADNTWSRAAGDTDRQRVYQRSAVILEAIPEKEYDVEYVGLTNDNTVEGFNALDTVKESEIADISEDIEDYVKESYKDTEKKYVLNKETSSVVVTTDEDAEKVTVTVTANYDEYTISYKKQVIINSNEYSAESLVLDGVSLEVQDLGTEEIATKVKDYVKAIIDTEDAVYELTNGEDNVAIRNIESDDELTVTTIITVVPRYNRVNKVTITIKHRLSFVWNNVDELAKDESQVFKTETKKVKVTDLDIFVSEGYKKLIDKDHDWNANARWNAQTKTLEILYKAKKVTITKTYNYQAQNETKTTYYNYEELKDYDFDKMSKSDFKTKFYNDDVVNKNNKVFKYVDSKVQANGTIANITVNYDLATYTVTYMGPNGELGKETVKYGQNAQKAWTYASQVPGFKGWTNEEGKLANLYNIKADMTVTASQKDKVTIKHVLDWNGETQVIDHEDEAFKEDYAYGYLKYALSGYVNPEIASIKDNVVTIKYYAIKVEVKFVDKKGNEIADKETLLIPYARYRAGEVKGYDEAKEIFEAEETIRDDETYTTYTLDKDATKVVFYDNTLWSFIRQFAGANMATITYKYDTAYDQYKLAINYVVRDPYYNDIHHKSRVGQYKETVNTKDFKQSKVQEIADEHIPSGYVKVGDVFDTKESGVDDWWTQEVRVEGRQENKTLTYSVGKYWHLTKVDGTYKRAKDWSDKDWYRFPNEEITVVGEIPTNYGFKEKTVDGMTFNNSNVTWNPVLSGDFVNGFYDNDGTKDGVVVGNYYITNADNAEELYAQENLTFKLEGSSTAAFDGSKFVEYPVADEANVIIWQEIKLENNNYNVYGVRTKTPRTQGAYTIEIEQALPLGMRNASIENVKKYVLDSICEKAADKVEEAEGALREEDEKHGSSVMRIEKDDFYELISESGLIENNILSCTDTITSNYYKYSLAVTLVERDLEAESFSQNKTTKELATKQAINNAIDAVKENTNFSELVFDKENAVVTGLPETDSIASGEYSLVVRLTTEDGSHTFEVKVPFKATRYSSGGGSSNDDQPINIDPNLTPEAGALLDDLRNNRPNDLITRAEFIGILANLFQVPEDREYDKSWNLDDCAQQEMIKKYATYTIVKGYSDEEFGQNDTITKEQMYTILARTLIFQGKCPGMTEEQIVEQLMNAVNAELVADWAREGVSIALKMGLAAATETTPTEPQGTVMRMTAADTLQKYIEIIAADTTADEVKVVEE